MLWSNVCYNIIIPFDTNDFILRKQYCNYCFFSVKSFFMSYSLFNMKLAAKSAGKTVGKSAAKTAIKSVAKSAVKKSVKTAAKATVKTTAKTTAKSIAKTAIKTGVSKATQGFATDVGRQVVVDGKSLNEVDYGQAVQSASIAGAFESLVV